ncbi:hypothetical protein PM082_017864 [Marasmius tenuissimus]|nr:hypothetical protein PM082_017864 [Marasmius tenuissimus]
MKQLGNEVLIWRQLRHPNVHEFLGITNELFEPSYCIVSPWMANGDVMSYCRERNSSLDVKVAMMQEFCEGLRYLHEHNPPIVHSDIKGVNILVSDDGHCRIGDFGLSTTEDDSPEGRVSESTSQAAMRGSLPWLAPELMNPSGVESPNRTTRDIYALGCTMYEILAGSPPFSDRKMDPQIIIAVLGGVRPMRPAGCPDHLWTTIEQCWTEDSGSRLVASQVVALLPKLTLPSLSSPSAIDAGEVKYMGPGEVPEGNQLEHADQKFHPHVRDSLFQGTYSLSPISIPRSQDEGISPVYSSRKRDIDEVDSPIESEIPAKQRRLPSPPVVVPSSADRHSKRWFTLSSVTCTPYPTGIQVDSQKAMADASSCARCRSLEVLCQWTSGTSLCQLCSEGGHDCIVPGRNWNPTPVVQQGTLTGLNNDADAHQSAPVRPTLPPISATLDHIPTSTSLAKRRRSPSPPSVSVHHRYQRLPSPHIPPLEQQATSRKFAGTAPSKSGGPVGSAGHHPNVPGPPRASDKASNYQWHASTSDVNLFGKYLSVLPPPGHTISENQPGHDVEKDSEPLGGMPLAEMHSVDKPYSSSGISRPPLASSSVSSGPGPRPHTLTRKRARASLPPPILGPSLGHPSPIRGSQNGTSSSTHAPRNFGVTTPQSAGASSSAFIRPPKPPPPKGTLTGLSLGHKRVALSFRGDSPPDPVWDHISVRDVWKSFRLRVGTSELAGVLPSSYRV